MATDTDEHAAPAVLWRHPDPKATPMAKFMDHINTKFGLVLNDYPSLYRWSTENVAEFWEEVWHFCGIRASKSYDQVSAFSHIVSVDMRVTLPPLRRCQGQQR
jgi:acetoacetyl-CoA synthetase